MKILVSSCLLGEEVRYDGKNSLSSIKEYEFKLLSKILKENQIFSLCPELEGGLEIPRVAAEIKELNHLRVETKEGICVTKAFIEGANIALKLCKKEGITLALMKANSPSCGNKKIYDGSFSSNLIDGTGVCTKLLSENGVKVFSENEIEQLYKLIYKSS